MGEVLGVGVTHYPPLMGPPGSYANILRRVLTSPLLSEDKKNPENWPDPMREEYANEAKLAERHQAQMVQNFRKAREAIDDFGPDAVIIFGDDQYENFKEDIVPPFCVFIHDRMESAPFSGGAGNVWEEPADTLFAHNGDRPLAQRIATQLIERGFPISFSYANSHFAEEHGSSMLTHAFLNALLYLDWDRKGFDYPVIPNTGELLRRGRDKQQGRLRPPRPGYPRPLFPRTQESPRPNARVLLPAWRESPRSAGRHARPVRGDGLLWMVARLPVRRKRLAVPGRRDRQEAPRRTRKPASTDNWASLTNAEITAAGDQEFKNWICLAGAMSDRKAEIIDYMETYIFNSNKCFAIFPPSN